MFSQALQKIVTGKTSIIYEIYVTNNNKKKFYQKTATWPT